VQFSSNVKNVTMDVDFIGDEEEEEESLLICLAMVAIGLLLSQRSVIAVTKKGLLGVSFALRVEHLLGC
jgi:hypothetical protein